MTKFDKDVFECLIDKVVSVETLEDGTINPYTIRFICKNGTEYWTARELSEVL